eukprot:4618861-Alexandrium_andersonii.AAC.1
MSSLSGRCTSYPLPVTVSNLRMSPINAGAPMMKSRRVPCFELWAKQVGSGALAPAMALTAPKSMT